MDENPVQLLQQLMHLSVQKCMKMLEEYKLKPGQAGVLFLLEKYDNLSQKEIADKLGVKPPSITVALKKMEHQGYITRKADFHDQRIIRIQKTEKGSACVVHIKEVASRMEKIMCKNMSREEILLMKRLLVQMRDNLVNDKEIGGTSARLGNYKNF